MQMSNLESVLYNMLVWFRWVGIIAIAIVAMAVLISEGAKEKLSPGKILTVAGSGVLAAVLFWILPTLINYARSDATVEIAPDTVLYR
jgi:uncharacterized membrane protein